MPSDREALIAAACRMQESGLTPGTSGNLSLRSGEGMLITPSAIPYGTLTPAMLPFLPLGRGGAYEGRYRPSSEWRFHFDILRSRPEVGAVIHAHPPHATALAIGRREIPACHYMIARFGGAPIRCAPYALFGTAALSEHVLAALEGRSACLMANHGCLVVAADIEAALAALVELEALATQYLLSLACGPVLLTEQEVADAIRQFATAYGPNLPR